MQMQPWNAYSNAYLNSVLLSTHILTLIWFAYLLMCDWIILLTHGVTTGSKKKVIKLLFVTCLNCVKVLQKNKCSKGVVLDFLVANWSLDCSWGQGRVFPREGLVSSGSFHWTQAATFSRYYYCESISLSTTPANGSFMDRYYCAF